MQRRNASTGAASANPEPRAPDKSAGAALPAAWRRILGEASSRRSASDGSILGFLLELLHDEQIGRAHV